MQYAHIYMGQPHIYNVEQKNWTQKEHLIVCFPLYEVQKQVKQIAGIKSEDGGSLWRRRK